MKKLWFAVSLITVLSVLLLIALVPVAGGPREPEYHGKKLTAWLADLEGGPSSTAYTNATLAIQQMGTNAVPFLVQMLYAKDSDFKMKCMNLLGRQHWVDLRFRNAFDESDEAFRALGILGTNATAAIPDLAHLLMSHDDRDGVMAAITLSQIGPEAAPALENALARADRDIRGQAACELGLLGEPSSVSNLLVALKDPDPEVRMEVASDLERFPNQTDVIVPALMNALDDPDASVRRFVMDTLGSLGADARPAIPKLLKMATDTNYDVSEAATKALNDISPKAAAKLNGK